MTRPDPYNPDAPHSDHVFSSTRWNVSSRVLSQPLKFLTLIVLAMILSPSEFGIMGMAIFVLGVIRTFRTLGTSSAIIQKPEIAPVLLDSVFWINFAFGCVLAVIVWLASGVLGGLFNEPRLSPVLGILAIQLVFLGAADVPQALLNRRLEFKALSIMTLSATVIYSVSVLSLAHAGFGVWSLAIASTAEALCLSVAMIAVARWRPRLRFSVDEIRQIFSFSAHLSGFNIVNYMLLNADKVLIGRFLGAADLGLYSLANRIVGIGVEYVQPAFINVLFPAMARVSSDNERLARGVDRASTGWALVFFPIIGWGLLGVAVSPALIVASLIPHLLFALFLWGLGRLMFR
jgi:PST family polysaccharide transporter